MTGFITTPETATAVTQAISDAQTSRGLSVFWLLIGMPIYSGEHAGMHFLPADDGIFITPLHGNPVQTPQDFPEFTSLIELLGGLDARINLPASDITSPP